MTLQQRKALVAGIGAFLVVAIGVWTLWGAEWWRTRSQDEVLAELSEVVENNAAAEDGDASESAGDGETDAEATTATSSSTPPASTTSSNSISSDAETDETATSDAEEVDGTTSTTEPETTASTDAETADQDGDESAATTGDSDEATTPSPASDTSSTTSTTTSTTTTIAPAGPTVASFEIVETIPHDTGAFTQGLEIADGRLFESTGLVGESSIRELDLNSGEVLRNTAVPQVFGEGLTIVGDTAIQITWQDGIAFRYDLDTFDVVESYTYEGQGWGLCLASEGSGNLVMSDGSSTLEFRDPDSFESLGSVEVLLDGTPIVNLNELECVGNTVWANIWLSGLVVEIDPATGDVLTVLDIESLRPESTESDNGAVWNGLAWDPSDGTLLVTGKRWPTIYRLALS